MPQFKPKKGQDYWMINSRFEVRKTVNGGGAKSDKRIAAGNYFETQKEAQAFQYLVKELAKGNYIGFKRRWWRFWL
jgi:hypothetical protein